MPQGSGKSRGVAEAVEGANGLLSPGLARAGPSIGEGKLLYVRLSARQVSGLAQPAGGSGGGDIERGVSPQGAGLRVLEELSENFQAA